MQHGGTNDLLYLLIFCCIIVPLHQLLPQKFRWKGREGSLMIRSIFIKTKSLQLSNRHLVARLAALITGWYLPLILENAYLKWCSWSQRGSHTLQDTWSVLREITCVLHFLYTIHCTSDGWRSNSIKIDFSPNPNVYLKEVKMYTAEIKLWIILRKVGWAVKPQKGHKGRVPWMCHELIKGKDKQTTSERFNT